MHQVKYIIATKAAKALGLQACDEGHNIERHESITLPLDSPRD
jgi:hypothetical protein